jgi:hypothetical protein
MEEISHALALQIFFGLSKVTQRSELCKYKLN